MINAALLALQVRTAPTVGDSFASFEARTLDAAPFAWHPGRTAVLSFCAFWCDTWKDQLPRVAESQRATKGLPVDYFTISVDGRWTDRSRDVGVGTMLGDQGGEWSHRIGIDRVPYTLVVDPAGRIVWSSYGTVRSAALTQAVRSALNPSGSGGTVYLTFDDFPSPRLSNELLDALRADGVPATFFCIGSRASTMPDVVRRAAREGHALDVHSWSHEAINPEVGRCVALLKSLGGSPDLYRAPGSEKVVDLAGRALGLSVVDPYDFSRPGRAELLRRVLSQVRAGSVIQLHAGVSDTLAALPEIVANLRKRGFTFGQLSANK